MMQLIARRFDTEEPARFEIEGGRISAVRTLSETELAPHNFKRIPWIAPGFVDIQVNGYGGQEFSSLDLTSLKIKQIVDMHLEFGVTRFCPTLTTQSDAVFKAALRAIARAENELTEVSRSLAGIHLEGPFISPEDGPRGAHPLEHCRPPDWEGFQQWQDAAQGRINLMTLSPEYAEAPGFIARATAAGVRIAIGHTAANSEQIRRAVDAGATLSTHLGNGAHRLLRRHPNYLWDQMADDRLSASLIVDGHHLPREVVKTIVRAKGPERIILVSDVSGLAGLPTGRYVSSGCELEILPDGRLVIAGQEQLLAGASLPIGVGISNMVGFANLSLATAVQMATANPARLLGLPVETLSPGDEANLVLFDWEIGSPDPLQVQATIQQGSCVFGQVPAVASIA